MTPLTLLTIVIITGFGYIAWKLRSRTGGDTFLQQELDRRKEEIGEVKNEIAQLQKEKNELAVNGKNTFAQLTKKEAECVNLQKERDTLAMRIAKYEAEEDRKQKKHEELIGQQEEARKALEDEKIRIRKEDEERQKKALEDRDRLWNEHEQSVVSLLNGLTKKEHCTFTSYSNTNLPEEFSGSLKPDFMIGFLEQYIIFDAKVSRSQDLQNYIKESVKKTALKVKGNKKIFSTIFLVVPTDAIALLKQLHYYEEGFTFYVVSPEALEPILANLKRMEAYEFTEGIDPQERENIVDMVAAFHFHVSTRNAHELGLMLHGLETLSKVEKMHPELIAEAIVKKAKMRNLNVNTAETKDLVANPKEVAQQLLELVEPKAKISKEDLGKLI